MLPRCVCVAAPVYNAHGRVAAPLVAPFAVVAPVAAVAPVGAVGAPLVPAVAPLALAPPPPPPPLPPPPPMR
jgi:DNA-binding IclR family transcriptional regulator